MSDFRCSGASVEDDEPIVGTAPTDTDYLLVECPGPWGRDAVTENRFPEVVRDHLASLRGMKVFLLRKYDGTAGPGTRVFRARMVDGSFEVTAGVLGRPPPRPHPSSPRPRPAADQVRLEPVVQADLRDRLG